MARTRWRGEAAEIPLSRLPAAALRAVLREGYARDDFRSDLMAGLVVGIVALPLAMALAIAAGVPPQHGLYTAIIAGLIVALLGGSRTQVTGPTAAFIVILAPIASTHGLAGLLLSGAMAGALLVAFGALRLGRLIEFVPHPVTTGFTAGIAVVIATIQVKDLIGLDVARMPDHYFERVAALFAARGTASLPEFAIGAGTLALLILLPRWTRRVPAPLIALPVAAVAAWALGQISRDIHIWTIAGRFSTPVDGGAIQGIPQHPPLPLLPWTLPGAGGQPIGLSFATIRELLPGAFAIAMLGAIESLLSAVVGDGMARTRHDPDAELIALGAGNLLAAFFGGIAATGAIARTATNIRFGARSPVAAMVHALTVLAAVVLLAPLIGFLPMASLAALLLVVAWNMADVKHFWRILRVAPLSDVAVLVGCFVLTVAFDMVIAVTAGVMMAALLFMRRMATVTHARIAEGEHPALPRPLPPGVLLYDIDGPLFFGAAEKAISTLDAIAERAHAVILRLVNVPVMDATGLVALESALERLQRHRCLAVLTGLRPQPAGLLRAAGIAEREGILAIREDIESALRVAEEFTRPPLTARRLAKESSIRRIRKAGPGA